MRHVSGHIAVVFFGAIFFGVVFFVAIGHADSGSTLVEESAIRVRLHNGASEVSIPIRSHGTRTAHLKLEWLSPKGEQQASHEAEIELRDGLNSLAIPFPLPEDERSLAWYRLHYRIDQTEGYLALPEIADHAFEAWMVAPTEPRAGKPYLVRFYAAHPVTRRPAEGVEVTAEITVDDDDDPAVTLHAVTGPDGFASLEGNLPDRGLKEVDLEVTARAGDFVQVLEADHDIERQANLTLATDKTLYQPGQTVHLRVLGWNPNRRALAGQEITFQVKDPEGTLLYRTAGKTTRFGIASADWKIPSNAGLGDYRLEVETEGEYDASARQFVKVSRYELPSFSITPKPDRSYYLPWQDAKIEVHADYLFGKPVTGARVRVVHQSSREWNYQEQKWDTDEEMIVEGVTGKTGVFAATVKLAAVQDQLRGQDYPFRDSDYAAYVTDPSTGRTEQKRFSLRASKEAIHIYWIPPSYISASYADGKPAECDVRIDVDGAQVAKARTNRYGVARYTPPFGEHALGFRATAPSGLTGHLEQKLHEERPPLRITAAKTLYRSGEPIVVDVISSQPSPNVLVEAARDGAPIEIAIVQLKGGRGQVTLPYNAAYRREIAVSAYAGSGDEFESAQVTVLYPAKSRLRLDARLDKASYTPGEEAHANFALADATGRPVESALGIAIVDKAVDYRVQTDAEFGGQSSRFTQEMDGVTRNDLYGLDETQPYPEGLDLLAEVFLRGDRDETALSSSPDYRFGLARRFSALIDPQFEAARDALADHYDEDLLYPDTVPELTRILAEYGIDWTTFRDPWGMPYQPRFRAAGTRAMLEWMSSGPDKQPGTADDFVAHEDKWFYFARWERKIKSVTGEFADIPDQAAVGHLLARAGIDPSQFKDPWGKSYRSRLAVLRDQRQVIFSSVGAGPTTTETTLATIQVPYFQRKKEALERILTGAKTFPSTEKEFFDLLRRAGMNFDGLRDPWGRKYSVVIQDSSDYSDRVRLYSYSKYGDTVESRRAVTPVTARRRVVLLQSSGPDGVRGSADDFTVAWFSRIYKEDSPRTGPFFRRVKTHRGTGGGILGIVMDVTGAVIPRAVTLARFGGQGGVEYKGQTDETGTYALIGLAAGNYDVLISSPGFQQFIVTGVPVKDSQSTLVNATLQVGNVTETVMVEAVALPLNTQMASMVAVSSGGTAKSTPRLREYFPETLLWQPSLETDANGRAEIRFKVADNITTWKMDVTGSTVDGEIADVETEFKSFQPFFLDFDPPPVLTQGDRISLPVTARNYLDSLQDIEIKLAEQPWFTLDGSTLDGFTLDGSVQHKLAVKPGQSAGATFNLRATAATREGQQRVTAVSTAAGDAIQKPMRVRPDGQEQSDATGLSFRGSGVLELTIPERAIAGSTTGELKIYPNLFAHVLEGIVGILERPHGCAEQTISSTYPHLLLLQFLRATGAEHPLRGKSLDNLRFGYQSLLAYRRGDGGFSYWTKGDADLALTSYALEFLTEASQIIEVDETLLAETAGWLLKQQRPDGSWMAQSFDGHENLKGTALLTADVARALAAARRTAPVQRALEYLARSASAYDEPYLLASFALASFDQGDRRRGLELLSRLKAQAKPEAGAAYWNLETNTPFYGWGIAGRAETTALALEAVSRDPANLEISERAVRFLLGIKDRYGVWYSTHASLQSLRSLVAFTKAFPERITGSGKLEITVNGKAVNTISLPPSTLVSPLVSVDVSRFLSAGTNRVELSGNDRLSTAQLVVNYFVPWAVERSKAPSPLDLKVSFDHTALKLGDDVTCRVKVERVGFRGYGMLLAEIGLPPGAEVDRQSLDQSPVSHYELQPDRLIVYLWPQAGGTAFSFKFRPRFRLEAKSASFVLYDYYNPESRVEQEPVRFSVY